MKINLLTVGAFAVALAMPLGVCAQQSQYPAPQGQYPAQQNRTTMPSPSKLQHRWMKRLERLNLSGDQQQHVQSLIDQYSQAHPEGSPRQPGSGRELRRQIMGVLTSDQQNQLRAQMRADHAQMAQRRAQMQQQGGQYPQQDRDQQGPPDQQQQPYQQGPTNQQPPDQGPPPGTPPV
jgi:hypothetical protein